MKKDIKLVTSSILLSALLVGCGGSSSSSVSSDDTLTGYFIDAEVEGVGYETTSGLKGITDKNGKFRYRDGDKVKLHIGNLNLGEVEPQDDGLVTPETLSDGDDELKTLLLRTLQALDSDGNTTNGITVPTDVRDSLESIDKKDLSEIKSEDELLKIHTHLTLAIDKDFDGHIDIDSDEAHNHFTNSMDSWEHGDRPNHISVENVENHDNDMVEHGNKPENVGNHDDNTTEHSEDCNNSLDINSMDYSTLTIELKDSIAYMGNEERLAYDVYSNLYDYHLNNSGIKIEQLTNIAQNAEIEHIKIVQNIVRKYNLTTDDLTNVEKAVANSSTDVSQMPSGEYDIASIQTLYNALYEKGIKSKQDALEVGCMVEVTDINDLDRYISMAKISNADDVLKSFELLREGSYSHYWAFDKGLKDMNITDGCCSLGVVGGVDYCHNEYPTHEHNETTQIDNHNEENQQHEPKKEQKGKK